MFPSTTTTRPRPIPSKAALRVLYQLAYISTGTVAGLGVLCAEERRRRTQLVQKIADNARRIRGSPRYVGHAAGVAVRREDGDAREEGYGGAEEELVEMGGNRRDAERGRDLPGVVDEEYERLYSPKRKRRKRESGGIEHASGIALAEEAARTDLRTSHTFEGLGAPQRYAMDQANGHTERYLRRQPVLRSEYSRPEDDKVKTSPIQRSLGRVVRGIDSKMFGSRQPFAEIRPDIAPKSPMSSAIQRDSIVQVDSTMQNDLTVQDGSKLQNDSEFKPRSAESIQNALEQGRVIEALQGCLRLQASGKASRDNDRLFQQGIHAALATQGVKKCADVLHWELNRADDFTKRCAAFIKAYGLSGTRAVLDQILFRKRPQLYDKLQLRELDSEVRAMLAILCSGLRRSRELRELYLSLDAGWREFVMKRTYDPVILKIIWDSTRNLDAVLDQMRRMVDRHRQRGNEKLLRRVDIAMSDIYLDSGHSTEALQTVARMVSAEPQSTHALLKVAQAYSKREAWDSVHQVLQFVQSMASFEADQRTGQLLDSIVESYLHRHTAIEAWRFVSEAMDKLKYRPSQWANRHILEHFVATKSLSLIPSWLHMLRVSGVEFTLDGREAARLIACYYRVHRPSHVLVMWFCRNLVEFVKSLDSKEFFPLIKESIGFDIGGGFERNDKDWRRVNAEKRLARLCTTSGSRHIPSPGHTYDKEIYFEHPKCFRQSGQAGNATIAEPVYEDTLLDDCEEEESLESARLAEEEFDLPESDASLSRIETEMRVALASKRYKRVLKLYERSLDGVGVPRTITAITPAIKASLRLHRDTEHAETIIQLAKGGGMNVDAALAPLLIHRVQNLDPADGTSADKLRDLALRYYDANEPTAHKPAASLLVTVADRLITNKYPRAAVDLLEPLVSSKPWEDSLDIVPFCVLLKARIALGDTRSVLGIARRVLALDLRMSRHFERELKRAQRQIRDVDPQEQAQLATVRWSCTARAKQQFDEAKTEGKKLVNVLAECMQKETTVEMDLRTELDEGLFGAFGQGRREEKGLLGTAEYEPPSSHALPSPQSPGATSLPTLEAEPTTDKPASWEFHRDRQNRLHANKAQVAAAIGYDDSSPHEPGVRVQNHLRDVRWMKQYRALLRLPMVSRDGRLASFRYHLPSDQREWTRIHQAKRARGEIHAGWGRKFKRRRRWRVGAEGEHAGKREPERR